MALTKVRGGGVDTVVLADSTNLNFGTGSDAKIFHDGNNTKFQHTGTGGLYVGADTFAITNGATDTTHISIDANGHVTKPLQSAFLAEKSSSAQNNITVDANTQVTFDSEVFDVNGDYASNTFTAPVTGKYLFTAKIRLDDLDNDANFYSMDIVTSNRTYADIYRLESASDPNYFTFAFSVIADMDASDTAIVRIGQNGGAAQSDASDDRAITQFGGYLLG
jgi:hypothetical protein